MRKVINILLKMGVCCTVFWCFVAECATLNELHIGKSTTESDYKAIIHNDKEVLKRNYISERKVIDRMHDLDNLRDQQQQLKRTEKRPDVAPSPSSKSQRLYSSSQTMSSSFLSKWNLPKINFRCDPLINFKLKQRLILLGACVTLGMDYLSDISQWRSYCAIEDTWVQGRFSLRGSELGWAKSWLLNLGLGEEHTAKFKLRIGLNLKSYKAYAKLRFRTEPISPFDIGDGISCAGKVPMPLFLLPMLRNIPLRVEYRLRVNTATSQQQDQIYQRRSTGSIQAKNKGRDYNTKVALTTGLGSLDLSLEELNFCLEWDEKSPLWEVGLVKGGRPNWKAYSHSANSNSLDD